MVLIGPQKCLFGCICTATGRPPSAFGLRFTHNVNCLSSRSLAEGKKIQNRPQTPKKKYDPRSSPCPSHGGRRLELTWCGHGPQAHQLVQAHSSYRRTPSPQAGAIMCDGLTMLHATHPMKGVARTRVLQDFGCTDLSAGPSVCKSVRSTPKCSGAGENHLEERLLDQVQSRTRTPPFLGVVCVAYPKA